MSAGGAANQGIATVAPTVMAVDRWEQGSILELSSEVGRPEYPWPEDAPLWGSGRDAMRGILAWGRDRLGWQRLMCPSYMCQHVAAALAMELPLAAYPRSPAQDGPAVVVAQPGDVVLDIATFGRHAGVVVEGTAPVIEDHTHDPIAPAAFASQADFAVVSLRKTFPLPDGGVAWSPRGNDLPPEPALTERHARSTLDRLTAMSEKRLYLEGGDVSKDAYRALSLRGEEEIAQGEISGISSFSRRRLESLPAGAWRERRAANLAALRTALRDAPGVRLLDTSFVATLVFDAADRRDAVRASLLADRIYPVVYWPQEERVLPGVREEDVDMSHRILSIHVDQRYTIDDMDRVAQAIHRAMSPS
jgi:hypothetical protein